MCIPELLCCTAEVSTILQINYTSIKNKNLKKKKVYSLTPIFFSSHFGTQGYPATIRNPKQHETQTTPFLLSISLLCFSHCPHSIIKPSALLVLPNPQPQPGSQSFSTPDLTASSLHGVQFIHYHTSCSTLSISHCAESHGSCSTGLLLTHS